MSHWWQTSRALPIGLDLGLSSLRMVQYAYGPKGLAVLADGHYRFPEGLPDHGADRRDACIEGLDALLKGSPFQGRNVVAALPDAIMRFKSVRMPMMPAEELAQAVAWEASDKFMAPAESLAVQHLCAGEVQSGGETRQEVILMAADRQAVDQVMATLKGVGLKPLALENTTTALARGFAFSEANALEVSSDGSDHRTDATGAPRVRVVLDIGSNGSNILILNGERIAFYRRVPIGGRHFDEAVAESLGIESGEAREVRRRCQRNAESRDGRLRDGSPPAPVEPVESSVRDALEGVVTGLAKEIGLCLRYYSVTFRGAPPERVSLCGGEACEPNLAELFRWQLDKEIEVARPFAGIDLSGPGVQLERRGPLPDWAVASGLALRDVSPKPRVKRGAA
ncbi:MAG: pilus assembly protein PilM [Planctomycetota bacterium]